DVAVGDLPQPAAIEIAAAPARSRHAVLVFIVLSPPILGWTLVLRAAAKSLGEADGDRDEPVLPVRCDDVLHNVDRIRAPLRALFAQPLLDLFLRWRRIDGNVQQQLAQPIEA